MIETFEKTLGAHSFFKALPPPHLGTIVGCAANVRFAPSELIFREGGPADTFYVLRKGTVAVEIVVPGRGQVTIETADGDEVLGWSWLFPPYRAHFDVRALTVVRALALDGACLRAKCDKDPVLGYELMKLFAPVLIQRLESTRLQLLDLYATHP
jgi:CRP/FNR family transcriptional regulator, cyclic AMP receptor protein